MKKTLAAVAVLGAFAGSALAADVTLYGVVDEGFAYNHIDYDGIADNEDTFSLNSGMQSGSRFGFKGTEDLGNGLKVGFILENGFTADNGADKGVFFDRESSLYLEGAFGKVAAGKLGSIVNGTSSWGKVGVLSAFGTSGWGGFTPNAPSFARNDKVRDNMIAYETPSFAGVKVYAQYAMGDNDVENESGSDRYYAVGATYNNGPVAAFFAVDSINYKSVGVADVDDSLTVTLGGSYDFEVAKVHFGAQYFDEVNTFGGLTADIELDDGTTPVAVADVKIKGFGIGLSASAPVAGGKLMAGVSYLDAEAADSEKGIAKDVELKRYSVAVGYDYNLSKRTDVYSVMSYMQEKYSAKGYEDVKPSAFGLSVGLRHKF